MTLTRGSIVTALLLALPVAAFGQAGGPAIAADNDNSGLLIAPPKPAASADRDTVPAARTGQPIITGALMGFVNHEPVFARDLFRPIDDKLRRLAQNSASIDDFKQGAVSLIQRQLITLETEIAVVSTTTSTLNPQEVERVNDMVALERMSLIRNFGGSEPAAEKELRAQNSSINQYIEDYRRDLMRKIYFDKFMSTRIVVTRDMEIAEYEKNPHDEPAQVELYTITLPVVRWLREAPAADGTPGPIIKNPTAAQVTHAEAQAIAQAKAIITQLKAGQPFDKLVENNDSRDGAAKDGGRWGMIKKETMTDTKLEAYAFALPAHSFGEPLVEEEKDPGQSRVVILKIGDKKAARTIPFNEVRDQIYKQLIEEQLRDLQDKEMLKLQKQIPIERVSEMVNVAVDAAAATYFAK